LQIRFSEAGEISARAGSAHQDSKMLFFLVASVCLAFSVFYGIIEW
jgi:hypothetical protein